MKVQSDESEEIARFKELFPDMKSPDSLYDKSPVSKMYCPKSVKLKTLSPVKEINHWKDKNKV